MRNFERNDYPGKYSAGYIAMRDRQDIKDGIYQDMLTRLDEEILVEVAPDIREGTNGNAPAFHRYMDTLNL